MGNPSPSRSIPACEADFAVGEVRLWESEDKEIMIRISEIITVCAAGRGTPALVEEWTELIARTKAVGRRVEALHELCHQRLLRTIAPTDSRSRTEAGGVGWA